MCDIGIFTHYLNILSWDYPTFKAVFGLKQKSAFELALSWNGALQ